MRIPTEQTLASDLPISLGEGQLESRASASPQRLLIAGVTAACNACYLTVTDTAYLGLPWVGCAQRGS